MTKHTRKNEVVKEREQGLGDWFEGELEICWKIQQGWDKSYSDPRRQAHDDALRNWEAHIDQLRRQEHEVSECKMVHTPNDTHKKETIQIEKISSLPEKPNPGSFTIPCSVDIFNINVIADLGANINIMSKSVLDELSLAEPKNVNIIVGMADKTRCVPHGIKENVLVKIDKFSFTYDFLIIDTKESNNKTIILGRPFLANIHAKMIVSTREISLGIMEDKVRARYDKVNNITKEKILQNFWDNKLGGQTQEKTITEEHEDPEKCKETKTRAIIGAMVNKLPEEWFSGVSKDKDDLEGIIDYLEPMLYDGFINLDDETYKLRRNKLVGMPYSEPLTILKEEAEITRYNLRAGEVFTKIKILNIKGFPKTSPNIADIRAEIINDKNSSLEDLSNTKRRHWCKQIYQWKEDMCTV
ncbi:reverse transcriptase domain-containing protein [Tanacetum coccineum]